LVLTADLTREISFSFIFFRLSNIRSKNAIFLGFQFVSINETVIKINESSYKRFYCRKNAFNNDKYKA